MNLDRRRGWTTTCALGFDEPQPAERFERSGSFHHALDRIETRPAAPVDTPHVVAVAYVSALDMSGERTGCGARPFRSVDAFGVSLQVVAPRRCEPRCV